MVRCVRIRTGADGYSVFEEGTIALGAAERGDLDRQALQGPKYFVSRNRVWWIVGVALGSRSSLRDDAPLEFETKSGAAFTIPPGDILIAQDNRGSGHKWRLIGNKPWRRAYVVYEGGADLAFVLGKTSA